MKKFPKKMLLIFSLILTPTTILQAQETDQEVFILSPSVPEEIKSLTRYELESFVLEYYHPFNATNYPSVSSNVTLGNGFVVLQKEESTLIPIGSSYSFLV